MRRSFQTVPRLYKGLSRNALVDVFLGRHVKGTIVQVSRETVLAYRRISLEA